MLWPRKAKSQDFYEKKKLKKRGSVSFRGKVRQFRFGLCKCLFGPVGFRGLSWRWRLLSRRGVAAMPERLGCVSLPLGKRRAHYRGEQDVRQREPVSSDAAGWCWAGWLLSQMASTRLMKATSASRSSCRKAILRKAVRRAGPAVEASLGPAQHCSKAISVFCGRM